MRMLLDTNAYSALMRGDSLIEATAMTAEKLYIPLTVTGELLAGFAQGSREQANIKQLHEFCSLATA